MALAATTARDLAAQREQVEQAMVDALTAPLANTLGALGFANVAAGAYAECLADHMTVEGIAHLFELLQNDADLRQATA